MTAGRTSWWPCDSAEHDRELNVELGEEFGPAGPLVMRVLKDLVQQQGATGEVRAGFRVLRIKAHVADSSTAREIVEHAAQIGALDELMIDGDGRRFTCRVSGWEVDSVRGRAAIKKAAQRESVPRNEDTSPSPSLEKGTGGDLVPPDLDLSGSVPSIREEKNREETTAPGVLQLCHLLAELILERDPKAKVNATSKTWLNDMRLLVADRGGDEDEIDRVIRWVQADNFERNVVLSPGKLRARFTALKGKTDAAALAAKAGPLRAVIGGRALENAGDLSRFDRFNGDPQEGAA